MHDPSSGLCYDGSGYVAYCAWGLTTDGNEFYCYEDTDSGNLVEVELRGGAEDDSLFFWYADDQAGDFDLEEYSGYSKGMPFRGRMSGLGHEDNLEGSRHDSDDYVDDILAGIGNDHVCTYGGDDLIDGNNHVDYICPGDGDDFVIAGYGDDEIHDIGGTNHLHGAPDDDLIRDDGTSSSWLYGETGNDQCYSTGSGSYVSCETISAPSFTTTCPASP